MAHRPAAARRVYKHPKRWPPWVARYVRNTLHEGLVNAAVVFVQGMKRGVVTRQSMGRISPSQLEGLKRIAIATGFRELHEMLESWTAKSKRKDGRTRQRDEFGIYS